MTKKTLDFIIRIQAEGTSAEKHLEAEEIHKIAWELAVKIPRPPSDRAYVKDLLKQALKGDLDMDVFKEFVKLTKTYQMVEEVAPRVKLIMRKEADNDRRNTRHE